MKNVVYMTICSW